MDLLTEYIPLLDQWRYHITGGLLALGLIAILLPRRLKKSRRHRLHKKNVAISVQLRKKLLNGFSDAQIIAYLKKIDPLVFEELILTSIDIGNPDFKVVRNTHYTGDGGADGMFNLPCGQLVYIQAKRYLNHINAAHVNDFTRLMVGGGAMGLFVHTGRTGALAKKYAADNPQMRMISGSKLVELIKYGNCFL